jgi:ABC-type Co2+ transport system permease subunit
MLKNMIQHIVNFVLGTAATAGTAAAITDINPSSFCSLEEVIKYIISIVGGILAAIIINLLKSKFPDLFEKKSKT